MPGLHIAVVTRTPQPGYVEALRQFHHTFVSFSTIEELLDGINLASPDLLLFDCQSVNDNVLAAANLVYETYKCPSIALVNEENEITSSEKILPHRHVCTVLSGEDAAHASLCTTIPIAFACFQRIERAIAEIAGYKQDLSDRKVIERAKGILMQNAGLSEHDAYKRLQRLSVTKKRKLIDIAKLIVLADAALIPDDTDSKRTERGQS